jgi:hypothetical protein
LIANDNGHFHILEWTKEIGYVGFVNDNEESIEDNSEDLAEGQINKIPQSYFIQ